MVYDKLSEVNLKNLVPISLAILAISFVILVTSWSAGTVPMSIDFKGGTLMTVYGYTDAATLESTIEDTFGANVESSSITDFSTGDTFLRFEIIKPGGEILTTDEEKGLKDLMNEFGIPDDDISLQSVGAFLSQRFLQEAIKAVLFAFFFMAIVVFMRFRNPVPSIAVVLSALFDIVVTFAIMIVLGIELSLGTLVALLLLIGYSVDTDIMLTTRLLVKKGGRYQERLAGAMKTGLTMSATTITALSILYLASTSVILKEIALVIVIGLIVDLVSTWIQNAGILVWYLERDAS